ncbi:UPF0184 protein AAEL002161-like [Anopheles stephensi]|uniref:Uncharacterized protein n=1 Tax=Anopheles stephensi TaxID=30069 RepID=A0A182Y527_ANOST|nr:UPF0184 protein AAEL002161-like [Anopheles stephensi]
MSGDQQVKESQRMPPEPKETAPCQEKTDDEQHTESSDEHETPANDEEEIDLEGASDEILELNDRLDSLSTVLDSIEQQNDDLRAQILLLLDSQRETLKSFKEENRRMAGTGTEPKDETDEPMEQS